MFRKLARVAAVAALLVPAGAARGQWSEKKTLTLEGAHRVVAGAVAEARKRNTTGVVAVVDDGGNLMAVERLDGTFAAGAPISIGKARTSALFKKPTKVFEDVINKGRTAMTTVDFTPLQGGVPITVDGSIVGAVGVSGASSAQEDEDLALAGAAALAAPPAKVAFYDAAQVREAFAKGAVLFDQGERYMVHASRREGAGQAEVHAKDADIIYVLDGTATFVTGGTVVDPKTTAPDEVRGQAIVWRRDSSARQGRRRHRSGRDAPLVPEGACGVHLLRREGALNMRTKRIGSRGGGVSPRRRRLFRPDGAPGRALGPRRGRDRPRDGRGRGPRRRALALQRRAHRRDGVSGPRTRTTSRPVRPAGHTTPCPHAGGAAFDDSAWEVIAPAIARGPPRARATGVQLVPHPGHGPREGRRLRHGRQERRPRDDARRRRGGLGGRRADARTWGRRAAASSPAGMLPTVSSSDGT